MYGSTWSVLGVLGVCTLEFAVRSAFHTVYGTPSRNVTLIYRYMYQVCGGGTGVLEYWSTVPKLESQHSRVDHVYSGVLVLRNST